ncbi:MAG: DUF3945 domain-containing protein [Prevotellaceae bacterium]|jgi:hypothetical protein|nr:DUF3945 domain-containing protein [Prevotellaceae bacterium]
MNKNLKEKENADGTSTITLPKQENQTQSVNSIDENRIDWSKLEQQWGVKRETIEKTGNMEKLLNWQKTDLLPVTAKFDNTALRTDARLSLREMPDGQMTFAIHAIRKEPELERPYFGVKFTEEDKKNVLTTGNLGRVVEAEFKPGEKTAVFISIDQQTNELVATRAHKIKIPEAIKGVQLDNKQIQELSEGKPVFVEGMTSKNGKEFSAHIQVNAEKRGIEFLFNEKKPEQSQNQGQSQNGEVKIPKTLLGVELSDKQKDDLKSGQTVYVSGMKDTKGEQFNAYVKINTEKGKLDFFKWNPEKAQKQGSTVIPDNASKTQVAVNSEGKTNESTKNVKEPLKKGQTQPTEKQSGKSKRQKRQV